MPRFDIAVIGGGLTGCAAAYYLAKAGARVVVIERRDINQGASGRNAGSLHFQLEHREVAHGGGSFSRGLEHRVELSRLAIEHWRGLEAELGENLELAMHGGLMLAETAAQVELLQRKCELERRHGLETHLLSGAEARSLAPYLGKGIIAASLCPDEGHCNPRLLTPAFARRSAALGADYRTRTQVTGIGRDRQRWLVATESETGGGETFEVDAVLNAAGADAAHVARLANFHLPIFPVGLLMNVTEKVGPFIEHLIQHVGRRISLKQTHSGNLLIGGGWSVRMRTIADAHGVHFSPGVPQAETIAENLRVASDVVPALADVHLLRTWSGIAGVTSDQLPLLGEIPNSRGFFVAAGGSGFTFGPIYARLISDMMLTGSMPENATAYSPARFNHINMFMG